MIPPLWSRAERFMDFTVILLLLLLAICANRSRDCHCGSHKSSNPNTGKARRHNVAPTTATRFSINSSPPHAVNRGSAGTSGHELFG